MKPYITTLALLSLSALGLWAAPPPAPVGFLWTYQGRTFNPFNSNAVAFSRTGIAVHDDLDNQWSPGAGTINLGVSSLNTPSSGPGTAAGDLYHETVSNTMSLNFGVTGLLTADTSPNNRDMRVDWEFYVAGNIVGSGSIRPFQDALNQSISLTSGPIALSSAESFDYLARVRVRPDGGGSGGTSGWAELSDISGTATINQSYDTWVLTAATPIPEASTTFLSLCGAFWLLTRRRR